MLVELLVELKIADPVKATFAVDDWDQSLHNLVAAAATSALGSQEFQRILCDRLALGEQMRSDVIAETKRWGIDVERVMVAHVRLLPEVSRQFFVAVGARLERARADIDEIGRLKAARLEADTSAEVAQLVAEAKSQYPLAISRAFEAMRDRPEVLAAYQELYELSLIRPHRTFAFKGFDGGEMSAADALMSAPGLSSGSNGASVGHGETMQASPTRSS